MSQAGKPTGLKGVLFGWIMERTNREMNRTIVSELGLTGSEKVLEIGCGTGQALAEISARLQSGTVLGLDHSPLMVKRANKKVQHKNNAEVLLAELSAFSAQPQPARPLFDQILVSNVHQFWAEPVECFQQIAQLLSSDSRLTVAIRIRNPNSHSFFSRIGYDPSRKRQLFDQLKQAGFNTLNSSQKKLKNMEVMLIHCSSSSPDPPLPIRSSKH